MARGTLHHFLQHLRQTAGLHEGGGLSDPQLLERFLQDGDGAAFEVLVWRHGGMVHDVCQRHLHNQQDVEDAFQASFLVLVRRAHSIRNQQSLSSWLYKVAQRAALRVRRETARRLKNQDLSPTLAAPDTADEAIGADVRLILTEEVNRLPEKYRCPVVLCYLQGLTTAEASRQLDCPQGTIHSRLASARQRLRVRLVRRGLTLSAAGLAVLGLPSLTSAAVPAALTTAAVQTILRASGRKFAGTTSSSRITYLAEGVVRSMFWSKLRLTGLLLLSMFLLVIGVSRFGPAVLAARPGPGFQATVASGKGDTVQLPAEEVAKLRIKTSAVKARGKPRSDRLELVGTLKADPDSVFMIRSRFAGEVLEIGQIVVQGRRRPLQFGDKVKKGQVLAVLWSKDLGQKKAALVDAVVNRALDAAILKSLEEAYRQGAVALAVVRKAENQVRKDSNDVLVAERTLRLWKLRDEEIMALRNEAEAIAQSGKRPDPERSKVWARLIICAPADGTLVERNIAVGDIAEPNTAVFKLADLSQLQIEADPPKRALPALRMLSAEQRRWTIRLAADPSVKLESGSFQILSLLGPQPHPHLIGKMDNKAGRFVVGQFVTVTILLPTPRQELAIPASALVEEGGLAFVLVQPDLARLQYTLRPVQVVRRDREVVHVVALPASVEDMPGASGLRPGDNVVTTGAAELKAILEDLKTK
jgi:cobalt-zinc-cadmium efflux system membrane fusion protein